MNVGTRSKTASPAAALAALLSLAPSGEALASSAAISFTSPTIDFDNATDLDGWQFTVDTSLYVRSLGFYDNPLNGISISHDIGVSARLLTTACAAEASRP